MVHLIGVHHSLTRKDILTGRSMDLDVYPSGGFRKYLESLQKGTRIGIEMHTEENTRKREGDLKRISEEKRHLLYAPEEGQEDLIPKICEKSGLYFKYLAGLCSQRLGFTVIPLDDIGVAYEVNQQVLKAALTGLAVRRVYSREWGEDEESNFKRLLRCNDAAWKAKKRLEKKHILARDQKLLEAIREKKVDLAVVGDGHATYWVHERGRIEEECGLHIDSYSADRIGSIGHPSLGHVDIFFELDAEIDRDILAVRNSLKRSSRLLESGRMRRGKKPDYVGVWAMDNPLKGYFEVYVTDSRSGIIEDNLGSAEFTGNITRDGVDLTKCYFPGAGPKALGDPIRYIAKSDGKGFYGLYATRNGTGTPFYMSPDINTRPIKLAEKLFEQVRQNSSHLEEIAKRGFF